MNPVARILIYILVLISPLGSLAQTVPELYYYSDLVRGKKTPNELYSILRNRFKRTNIDEILFPERPNLAAPRFSRTFLDNTLVGLGQVGQQRQDLENLLSEKHEMPPYQVFSDGTVSEIPDFAIAQWRKIPKNLRTLFSNRPASSEQIKILVNDFVKEKTAENIERIQSAVLGSVIEEREMFHIVNDPHLLPQDYRAYMKAKVTAAINKSKDLQLPGKVAETFPVFAERLGLARIENERKGLFVTPMSRFEAIFKGVGPGECVRSCNYRYMDALLKDAIYLKILRDGEEVAYVGLYRTKIKKLGQAVWFVETIQGPMLSDVKTKTEYIKGIVNVLQVEALKENSLVAFPAKSDNSYNFKEVMAELSARPEVIHSHEVDLEYRNQDDAKDILSLVKKTRTELDKRMKEASGYDAKTLINGFVFNEGKAFVLFPQPGLPDYALAQTFNLFQGKQVSYPRDYVLPLDEKINLVVSFYDDLTGAKILFDRLQTTTSDVEKNLLRKAIFKETPTEYANADFATQYAYVDHQIKNVTQSFERAQRLKTELALKANTASQWLSIFDLGDTKPELLSRFMKESLVHIEKIAEPGFNWNNLYGKILKLADTDTLDHFIARMVARNLKTLNEYLTFLNISAGNEKGSGLISDIDKRQRVILETWELFLPVKESSSAQLEFLSVILTQLNDNRDLAVRRKFMAKQKDLELLPKLNSIGIPGSVSDYFKHQMSLLNADVIEHFYKKLDADSISDFWMKSHTRLILSANQKRDLDYMIRNGRKAQMCRKFYIEALN